MSTRVSADATERETAKVRLAAFTAELFVGRVGDVFRLTPSVESPEASPAAYEVELIEVKRGGKPADGGNSEL